MSDETGVPLVELRLHSTARAPFVARRVVQSLITTGSRLRGFDAAVLAGEAVALHLCGEEIQMRLSERGRFLELAVESGCNIEIDEIVTAMFDRLASSWESENGRLNFEIELVRRRSLGDLPDVELFELLPDRDARDELYERYAGFAIALARRVGAKTRESNDLEQAALGGLVKAIDSFDPTRGVKFTTYAGRSVSGALKHYMRDQTWSVRVPRSISESVVTVRRVQAELAQSLGRLPTDEQVAEAAELPLEDVIGALEAGATAYNAMSLDAPADETDGDAGPELGIDDEAIFQAAVWESVRPHIQGLPDVERRVLHLRFFDDLSQREIAEIIGVSQMQVSRLLSKAIGNIQAQVGVSLDPS